MIDFEAWSRRDPIELVDGVELTVASEQEQAQAAARIEALEEGGLKTSGAPPSGLPGVGVRAN